MLLYGFVLAVPLDAAQSSRQWRAVNQAHRYSDDGEVWSAPDGLVYASTQFYSKDSSSTGMWCRVLRWLRRNLSRLFMYTADQSLAVGKGARSASSDGNDRGEVLYVQFPRVLTGDFEPKPRVGPDLPLLDNGGYWVDN